MLIRKQKLGITKKLISLFSFLISLFLVSGCTKMDKEAGAEQVVNNHETAPAYGDTLVEGTIGEPSVSPFNPHACRRCRFP